MSMIAVLVRGSVRRGLILTLLHNGDMFSLHNTVMESRLRGRGGRDGRRNSRTGPEDDPGRAGRTCLGKRSSPGRGRAPARARRMLRPGVAPSTARATGGRHGDSRRRAARLLRHRAGAWIGSPVPGRSSSTPRRAARARPGTGAVTLAQGRGDRRARRAGTPVLGRAGPRPRHVPLAQRRHLSGPRPCRARRRRSRWGSCVRGAVPLEGAPLMSAIALTRRYVVMFDLPIAYSRAAALVGARTPYVRRPDRPARIGLLRAGPAPEPRWLPIEPCRVLHTVNSYDDGDRIVVDAVCRPPEAGGRAGCRYAAAPLGGRPPNRDGAVAAARRRAGVGDRGPANGRPQASAFVRHGEPRREGRRSRLTRPCVRRCPEMCARCRMAAGATGLRA